MRQPIQILHLISSNSFMGAERVVAELARATSHEQYQVHVAFMTNLLGLEPAFKSAIAKADVQLVCISPDRKILSTLLQIAAYARKNNIHIIHSHGYKSDVYALLVRLFFVKKVKTIASSHGWLLNSKREGFYKKIDLYALKFFDGIVAIKKEIAEDLTANGISANKIRIIDNGIDVFQARDNVRPALRAEFGLGSEHLVIGCIARLSKEKAQSDLINAFSLAGKELPLLRLLLIGDGPCMNDLKKTATGLNVLDKVFFAGFRRDARDFYDAIDIFALVSVTEGLPMAMLEAMAARKPVVVSRVGAIPDVIEDGFNGLLVEPGDIEGIAAACCYLVENPARRLEMGEKGRNTVVSRYSSDRMTREYEKLYEEVIAPS